MCIVESEREEKKAMRWVVRAESRLIQCDTPLEMSLVKCKMFAVSTRIFIVSQTYGAGSLLPVCVCVCVCPSVTAIDAVVDDRHFRSFAVLCCFN